ncbi:MAG: ankyrin repeat domain-containing protein, partial [Akkermansia sp.]|nr:ankyrin repeat domain-containing protein [Akkermansia sp.]
SLLQHFDSLRQTAAAAKSHATKLSAESLSRSCDTLPADPPAFRSFITDFCNNPAVAADSLSNEQLLSLLGWDSALSTAQEEAERKAQEEAERIAKEEAEKKNPDRARGILSENGISESEYSSTIIRAAGKGDHELLALLITAGADVNAINNDGMTPLCNAAYYGRVECVRLLLAASGIDVNKSPGNGKSPLYWAAYKDSTECVSLLLAAPGIEVNKVDDSGNAPLHMAAFYGHVDCVRLLLAAPGIEINKENDSSRTPLNWAESLGRTECAQLIRDAGGHK